MKNQLLGWAMLSGSILVCAVAIAWNGRYTAVADAKFYVVLIDSWTGKGWILRPYDEEFARWRFIPEEIQTATDSSVPTNVR